MQDKIRRIVEKYIGIPYQHRGRTLVGLDCWGLALLVYKDLGYVLYDIDAEYDETITWKDKSLFIENYHREWRKVTRPEPLDGILFQNKKGIVVHGGLFLEGDKFLHSSRTTGVVIARMSNGLWKKSFEGFYQLKERHDH